MLFLLALLLVSSALAEHIFDVDVASLDYKHQMDFVHSLLNPENRRRSLETEGFFRLEGVSVDGTTEKTAFIVKPAFPSTAPMIINGEDTVHVFDPIFHGYAVGDLYTVVSVSFPHIRNDTLSEEQRKTPVGEVHTSNGDRFYFGHHSENGLTILHHNETLYTSSKRNIQLGGGNGLSNGLPMLVIDTLIGFDSGMNSKHGGASGVSTYYAPVVALTNAVYERDIVATLNILALRQVNVPNIGTTITRSGLDAWGASAAQQREFAQADYAYYLLQGPSFGVVGLSYVGTVCVPRAKFGYGFTDGKFGGHLRSGEGVTFAHEAGHGIGSPHTFGGGYSPDIDGGNEACPGDGGTIMSYCTGGTAPTLGAVGLHGSQSERVNQKIRGVLEAGSCISKGSGSSDGTISVKSGGRPGSSCSDTRTDCSIWLHLCGQHQLIIDGCKHSCNACGGSPPPPPPSPPSPPPSPPSPPSGGCSNTRTDCSMWLHLCGKHEVIIDGCKRDCNDCGGGNADNFPASSCTDARSDCSQWGHLCGQHQLIIDGCKKSCGVCQKRSVQEEVAISAGETTILYNQGDKCSSNKGSLSVTFARKQGAEHEISASARSADDFILPAGKTWEVSSLKVLGIWKGAFESSTPVNMAVTFFNRKKTICQRVAKIVGASASGTVLLKFSEPCHLIGGNYDSNSMTTNPSDETYFVSVFPVFTSGSDTLFYWSFSMSSNGENYQFRDRQGAASPDCKSWTDGTKCTNLPRGGTDLCFAIGGLSRAITDDDNELLSERMQTISSDDTGGAGIVGEDSGELIGTQSEEYQETLARLQDLIKASNHKTEQEMDSSQNQESDIDGRPAYVIPVAVTLSVLGAILILVIIGVIIMKREPSAERF